MDYRRSRVYSAPVPKMPPGLIELMEGLSKDVLKNNPTNIYEFCADHMQKLLQIRDNPTRNILNLEQKITKAQNIVKERAKQHREKYDRMITQQRDDLKFHSQLRQHVDEAPTYVCQQNVIKIPEKEISVIEMEVYDANGLVEIKEKNKEMVDISESAEHGPTSLTMNNPAEEIINEKDTLEKGNMLEGNKQRINVNCNECDKSGNKIGINTNLETDICTNIELCLESQIETKLCLASESLVRKESLERASEQLDQENTFNKENKDINDVNITEKKLDGISQDIVDVSDENMQSELSELKSSEVLEAVESLNSESMINILCKNENSDAQQPNRVESTDHIQGKDSSVCTNNTETPVEKNESNVSMDDGKHHNGMDLETAAITIQKVFRTFLFRSKTTSVDDATNVDINLFINDKDIEENINVSNINKERRGISRMDTVLQTVNEEKSLSLSTDDSSTLSSAATIIQAQIRGFLVRNKLHVNKTASSSLPDSDGLSGTSMEIDSEQQKGKTILNIHIVPERGHFMSRDESIMTSMELSLDGSPPSTANLHPHSYDINERRKQLKREDAVQSVSPPSDNSSTILSEDVDSVREVLIPDDANNSTKNVSHEKIRQNMNYEYSENDIQTAVETEVNESSPQQSIEKINLLSDEMDVVTPFIGQSDCIDPDNVKLMNSSECHDVVLPTKVSRSDTSVVSEFHNVLAYFLLWN